MTISMHPVVLRFVLPCLICFSLNDLSATEIIPDSTFEKALVKPRVESMDFFVRTKYNSDIERHVRGFVILARTNAQRMLGESTIYFPTIERKIKEMGLPDDLKYLTIVESMLDPKAESYAGAKGMWQLMPFIAKDYNIHMGEFRDERFHIEKSASAGLGYLKSLYERFDNWELALAAYNCGAGRINRTLKQTGKKTYWGIRHLLPRQTREFVPKLVAVKYLFQYYQHHNLKPTFPGIDMQITRSIKIEAGKSYQEIGNITELTAGLISFLNPSYLYEPKYVDLGKIELILPARVITALEQHNALLNIEQAQNILFRSDSSSITNPYYKVIYSVPDSMSLQTFCDMYDLSSTQIWLWNKMTNTTLHPGQELFIYEYKDLVLEYRINKSPIYLESIALL